jgi:hypothetical protein
MRIELMIAAALATATACESPAVRWEEPVMAAGDTLGGIALDTTGGAVFLPVTPGVRAAFDGACERSMVSAQDGGQVYATWLSRRTDSTVVVLAARSRDSGRSWSAAATVDSLDVSKVGCNRPGPSIAVGDGYVYIAYSLQAPEGFGVFFAHSMDSARTFHSPLSVIYGDRLSRAAIAADGPRLVVGYEDPSGTGHRIDIALSSTQGHTFQPRVRGSPDEMSALQPEVAIRGGTVALSFAQPAGGPRIIRVGHIR